MRDKALALEHYSRQAQNIEAERKAAGVRIRAERRAGELLKELEKSKGGRPEKNSLQRENSSFKQERERAGISEGQAARWQKLAEISQDKFDAALADPEVIPSTQGLIDSEHEAPIVEAVDSDALAFWGWLREGDRSDFSFRPIAELVDALPAELKSQVQQIIPRFEAWLLGKESL